ncbi:MAG: hypothetical protein E7391_05240 [Ruminococcaceae bacterium]|nr:hypothetical protein [Oscillospiraceae bacterium]
MKKVLSTFLIFSIVLSMFTISSFALDAEDATIETVVWTQDFEDTTGFDKRVSGTYLGGARWTSGGGTDTKLSGIKTEGDNNYFYCTGTASYHSRFKIYLDQSAFEDGESYKVTAKATYILTDNSYAESYPTLKAGIGMTDTTGIAQSGTIATNTFAEKDINLNEETVIETNTFVYDKETYTASDEAQINAYITMSAGMSTTNIRAMKLDDVKVVKISKADNTDVIDEYKSICVNRKILNGDDYIEGDIHINTYVNETDEDTAVIVYVMNHGMQRVGTESDVSIIKSFLDEKEIVVTVDYRNNPNAVSPKVEYSVKSIMDDIWNSKKYVAGYKYKTGTIFSVPQGNRIKRDVKFFSLYENASVGTKEAIVASWNTDAFKNAHGKKIPACEGNNYEGGWFEATDISQLVKQDGMPIDPDLKMDIVYPSIPKVEAPVFMHASSWQRRSECQINAYDIGLGLRGYATVIYDHEYFPMARDDHYGYYGGAYGVAPTNGVKVQTAAARCVKYYADEFGYANDHLMAMGHSKGSYTSYLGRSNPEAQSEMRIYEGFNDNGETYGPQPFLKDKNGNDLSGNVQLVYTSMGEGSNMFDKLLNETSVPHVIACGIFDDFGAWNYWEEEQAAYIKWDIPHLAISMTDMGHSLPYGVDPDLKYDRFDAALDFFDYYLKPINASKPKVVYTYPAYDEKNYDGKKDIIVKLTAPTDLEEFKENVSVVNADTNKEVSGVWTKCAGSTEFHFVTDEFVNKNTYTIKVSSEMAAKDGETFESDVSSSFKVNSGDVLYSSKDAYITKNSNENSGNENLVKLSYGQKYGFIEFDLTSITDVKTGGVIEFYVENDAAQQIEIYALKEEVNWDENSVNSQNAPSVTSGFELDSEKCEKVATAAITGSGLYSIDVTEFIEDYDGEKVTFVLVNTLNTNKEALNISFDNLESFKEKTPNNTTSSVSDTYNYIRGGATLGVDLVSDKNHSLESGKSIYIRRNKAYNRVKFFNTFGKSELTKDDIGKIYDISFWVYPEDDATITSGIMSSYYPSSDEGVNPYYDYDATYYGVSNKTTAKKNEWTKVNFKYEITKGNVDGKIGMLTIATSDYAGNMYIDDILVSECSTDVEIVSKEGKNIAEGKFAPKLAISSYTPDSSMPVRIKNVRYNSLAAAILDVPTDLTKTEIILDTDIEIGEKISIDAGKNVVLKLNGHTIDVTNCTSQPVFTVAGKLRLENGNITDYYMKTETVGRGGYVFHVYGNENSLIEVSHDVTIDTYADYGAIQTGKNDSGTTLNGTVIIHDGATIKTRYYALYTYPDSNAFIYGGTFENTSSTNNVLLKLRNKSTFATNQKVYGGTFITQGTPTVSDNPVLCSMNNVFYGGTFSDKSNLEKIVPEGYKIIDNANGTYTIAEKNDGYTVEGNLDANGTLSVKKHLRNNKENAKDVVMIVAIYDDNENLIATSCTKELKIDALGEIVLEASVDIPKEAVGENKAKVMIWNSYEEINPIVFVKQITNIE